MPADIPGMELAGEVEALGPGVTRFEEGDRVMAVVGGGAQAELAIMHELRGDARCPSRSTGPRREAFPRSS